MIRITKQDKVIKAYVRLNVEVIETPGCPKYIDDDTNVVWRNSYVILGIVSQQTA